MTLDTLHASFLGKRHELILEFFLAFCHYKTYIHYRSVFNRCCTSEHAVSVDFAVEKFCLRLVDLLDRFHASLFLKPAESLVHDVDREHRRSIEH